MVFKKSIYILLLSCFGIAAANAVTLNLDAISDNTSGWADKPNDFTLFGGAVVKGCDFPGQCYQESGYYVGTAAADHPTLGTNLIAHIHGANNANTGTVGMEYENDSVGVVVKAVDNSNFNLNSLDLDLHSSLNNTYDGDFVIASFGINTDGSKGGFLGSVSVANGDVGGQDGVLDLSANSVFQDVGLIYMYYDPFTLDTTNGVDMKDANGDSVKFTARIDDINVTSVSAVPIPAAVYLFATGLAGLISLRGKNQSVAG